MAKKLKKFKVHGAFKSKEKARKKEKSVNGFILMRTIKGHRRYVVLTQR